MPEQIKHELADLSGSQAATCQFVRLNLCCYAHELCSVYRMFFFLSRLYRWVIQHTKTHLLCQTGFLLYDVVTFSTGSLVCTNVKKKLVGLKGNKQTLPPTRGTEKKIGQWCQLYLVIVGITSHCKMWHSFTHCCCCCCCDATVNVVWPAFYKHCPCGHISLSLSFWILENVFLQRHQHKNMYRSFVYI